MRKVLSILLITACFALTACESSVNVDATANVSAPFSSVLVTVKEVWVNTNATATPDDTSWIKFPLSEPETLDLVGLNDGVLSEFASQLQVGAGTYRQLRLFLVDRTETLTDSAKSANATFNNQVTYFNVDGEESTLPLELPNAAQGIGIETELVVPAATDAILAALATGTTGTSTTSGLTGTATGSTITTGTPGVTLTPPGTTVTSGTIITSGTTDTSGTITSGTTVPSGTTGTTGMTGTPGSVVTTPGSVVTTPGTVPTTPGSVVTTPGSVVTTPGTVTTTPGSGTTTPGAVVPGTDSASSVKTVTARSGVVFDATRDLTAFLFSDQPGFLLNPSLSAFDPADVGTIQGQLDLSQLTIDTGTGRPDIEVTAEQLNDDSTRHVEVASAQVSTDGTFVLYPLPLPANQNDSTTYDLVIHGPGVQTVVILQVPVTKGPPDSATALAFGTVTLSASDSFAANLTGDTTVAERGARIGFYQTLPDDNAPYLVAQATVDPLSGQFATDEMLPSATSIVFGTFGNTFVAAAPQEGASKYSVSALSTFYGDGDFAQTLLAPPLVAAGTASFTVPDVSLPSGAEAGTIAASVGVATPGKYDKGALLVTHNGSVIATAPLDDALIGAAPSTVVNVSDVPAGAGTSFERGVYFLEAWVWSSANPTATFARQPVTGAVDLRTALTASPAVPIN